MRYTRHKRMINGDARVKNGIFIPTGEKIWRSNGIREKRKKDPYNICQERRLVVLECHACMRAQSAAATVAVACASVRQWLAATVAAA
ncbi:hypothetical protein Tco_1127246 [Tanacetum coccineum]